MTTPTLDSRRFGALVKARREARHWTRSELARRLGVPESRIVIWEERGGMPRPDRLTRLMRLLEIGSEDVEQLIDIGDSRRCRVCGCTDADCSGCIKRTGKPCYWIEEDLCSACDDVGVPW